MAKGQTQASQSMAQQNYGRANQQGQQTQNYLWGQLPGATTQAQGTYNTAAGAYTGYLGGTGAYDPSSYAATTQRNTSNVATGGYNPETLKNLQGQQQQNIATGAYDPSKMSELQSGYEKMTGGGIGGIDPTQMGKLRSGYENLASTGGIDATTAGAMERQAASSAQGVYSTLGQKLAKTGTAQGISAGGETAQMARQASQAAAEATTGAEAEIGKLRQTGTIAGLGGLSGVEQGAAGLQQSALAGQAGLAGSEAANRLAATGQYGATAASQAQGTLTASAAQQELETGAATQRIQAAGGLTNLYNSSPGYVNSIVQQIMQSQYQTGQLTTEQSQIMAELSKNPGMFQTILNNISQLAGAAGGVMTGIGALP